MVEHRGAVRRGHLRRHPAVGRAKLRLILHVGPSGSSSSSTCRETRWWQCHVKQQEVVVVRRTPSKIIHRAAYSIVQCRAEQAYACCMHVLWTGVHRLREQLGGLCKGGLTMCPCPRWTGFDRPDELWFLSGHDGLANLSFSMFSINKKVAKLQKRKPKPVSEICIDLEY